MTATKNPESINVLMAKVMNDVGVIGKNRTADQRMGGYAFRGIDDLYNALHGPLAAHGVFFAPEVLEETESSYKTSGGATMRLVRVKVRYRFHGPAGDHVEAVTIGEAADTGDKAANKAMTAALKYLLFQVFCIAVEGDEDPDAQSPQLTEKVQGRKQHAEPKTAGRHRPEDDSPPFDAEGTIRDDQLATIAGGLTGEDAPDKLAKILEWAKVDQLEKLSASQADIVIGRMQVPA